MVRESFKIQRVSDVPVSAAELLADLRATAAFLGKNTVGQTDYRRLGKYDDSTCTKRFGIWNKALKAAGLSGTRVRVHFLTHIGLGSAL